MDEKKKTVDFWSGAGIDFDSKKALEALAAKVTAESKDAKYFLTAPRLTLQLATRPRKDENKAEQSIFQSMKGFPQDSLLAAGVLLGEKDVTFIGFPNDAAGYAALDAFLTQAGALRRSTAPRSKGWAFISDTVLANTPKLAPTDRVGAIAGARQISIALPPQIARALPSWAGASSMVGFFCECGAQGVTLADLEAFLKAKKAENANATNNANTTNTNNNANNTNANTEAT